MKKPLFVLAFAAVASFSSMPGALADGVAAGCHDHCSVVASASNHVTGYYENFDRRGYDHRGYDHRGYDHGRDYGHFGYSAHYSYSVHR